MKQDILPEEKLLRLIRGGKGNALPRKDFTFLGWRQHLTFSFVRNGVIVLFFLSLVYLAACFIYPLTGLKKIQLPKQEPEKINVSSDSPLKDETKPLEFYTQALKQNQVFGSTLGTQTGQPVAAAGEALKDISLVGIISGEPPQAVIEDKKAQRTYYVTKGQNVNDYQLEDIQEGKIILNYNGQKYELYI